MVQDSIKNILKFIGEDITREGLIDTPKRMEKMYNELFYGYTTQPPKITTFKNGNDGIVVDEAINDCGTFNSFCEHHFMPIINGNYYFSYIPNKDGYIMGLSKIGRVVDYYSARLQVQERLTHQIITYIWNELSKSQYQPKGMGLVMEAEHLCKTMRGVKKAGRMRTTKLMGCFLTEDSSRQEFLGWVNSK